MPTFDEAVASALEALRAEYLQVLPGRLDDLLAAFKMLRQLEGEHGSKEARRAAWDQARRHAHALRGTAGSYGFSELSRLAALLEDEITGCDPSDANAAPICWSRVEPNLVELARVRPS